MQFYYRVAKVEPISKSLLRKFGIGKIGMKKIERSSLGIFIILDKEKIGVPYGHEIKIYVSFARGKKKEFRRILHEMENSTSASKKESKKKKGRAEHPTRGTKLTVEFQRNTNTHEHDNGNKDGHAQRRRANDE